MNNTCLVIGANGFIGSHLVDFLASNGYKIKALDRYSTDPQYKLNKNVEIIKADLFNLQNLKTHLKDVDYLFHSFSATTPFSSDSDPITDIDANLKHNVRIFELCREVQIKKIIFISSGGAVYGTAAENKLVSELTSPAPVSPYGICKLATEHYLDYFKRKYGLQHVIYRLTNPYGPRQVIKQHQGVIPAFLHNINQDKEIVLFGDGSASRDYIYIKDVASMIGRTFAQETKHEIYNIGSGKQTTLNQIIVVLENILQKKLKVERTNSPATFLSKTQLDINRFTDEFGKEPLTTLEKGLRTIIKDLDY